MKNSVNTLTIAKAHHQLSHNLVENLHYTI